MISNEKPRTLGTGQITNDGESIANNVTAIDRLKPNQEFIFGKSCPTITDRDIWEKYFLHDAGWIKSKSDTYLYLKATGYPALWSREDRLRAMKFESRKAISNLMHGGAA
jgi:hypothetical protein